MCRDSSACVSGIWVSSQRGSQGRRDHHRARTDCTPDIPKEISYARPAQRPSLRIWLRRWVFTGPGSPLPKSCHQPSRPPPDVAARPDPRPRAPMSPIGALGPTTARRSAVLMLGGLPAPTILEWF